MTERVNYPSNDPTVSNFAWTKSRSAYHYEPFQNDYRFDAVVGLGRFSGDWTQEVETTINRSVPRLNYTANDTFNLDYDLARAGAPLDAPMFNVDLTLEPVFQKMCDQFALDRVLARVNVQLTGQVCFTHVDKVDRLNNGIWDGFDQDEQKQIFIMLTDYQAGHFLQMGNKIITHWRAGDFFDFAHRHVPHQTANSSWYPRVMIQLTGIATPETHRFLKWARYEKTVPV
jgi:hypothetical protein